MHISKNSVAHWSFAGGSLLAAALALIPILADFIPALNNIKEFDDAFHLYGAWVRAPLLAGIAHVSGADVQWPILIDLFVFWVGIFFAVNVFIHQQDGLLVWGHIRHNSCFVAPSNFLGQIFCTLPKYVVAFLLSPLIYLTAVWAAFWTGRNEVTMGYVTIDPGAVGKLIAASASVAVLLITAGAWLFSRPDLLGH